MFAGFSQSSQLNLSILYNYTCQHLLITNLLIYRTSQHQNYAQLQHFSMNSIFSEELYQVYIQNSYQMTFVKKSKAQSCLHAIREGESRLNFQKYVIIDSENEDEVINMKQYDSFQDINRVLLTEDKRSVILKSKGSTVTNFLSHITQPERSGDHQIFAAESQVKSLQKECQLLQDMINDMIEEQSKLTVLLRKRERAKSFNKNSYADQKKQITSCLNSFIKQNSEENTEETHTKLANTAVKEPLSNLTPLYSKNVDRPHKKSMEIVKTVEIKNISNPKKGQQNDPFKKLECKKKNSISKIKQSHKARHSICKIGSKAL